jgi:hypothetical protein
MKHFNRLFILGAALIVSTVSFGQFWTEDFSDNTKYTVTLGGEGNDGTADYFQRTDGSNINKTYTNTSGFFFAGQDIDDANTNGWTSASPSQLTWADIDISGKSQIIFSVDVGSTATNRIDNNDYLLFEYSIDGGNWIKLLAFENDGTQFNTFFQEDTNFDGNGDGTIITSALGSFQKPIVGSGLKLSIRFTAAVDAGDEDFAIDNLKLTEGALNSKPVISNIAYSPIYIQSSTTVNISAEVTDADGTITQVGLVWGTDKDVLTNPILMTNGGSGNIYTSITPIPAQANGTTVYFALAAVDNEPDTTLTSPQSYTVTDPKTATLPYTQEFSANLGDFYSYSASGDTKKWGFSNGYAIMNGFNSGELERDFLITPAFDFTTTQNEVISFKTWKRFGTGDNTDKYLKLMYSTDYAGIGDATAATWTEVSGVTMATELQVWTKTEDIDVSMVTGSKVHFAFVYNYAADYVQWQVDSVVVKENVPTSIAKNHAFATIVNTVVSNNLIILSENAVQLRIYNLAGREVKSVGYAKGEVSLSSLPKGIYIVKLTQGNNIITRRISKQ